MPTVKNFFEAGVIIAELAEVKSKNVMGSIWLDLVEATPVCSGYARGSWFVTPNIPKRTNPLGPPPEINLDMDHCTEKYSYPSYPNLKRYTRNFSKWYIVNLAPYVEGLNNGDSKKASSGWVEDAISARLLRS